MLCHIDESPALPSLDAVGGAHPDGAPPSSSHDDMARKALLVILAVVATIAGLALCEVAVRLTGLASPPVAVSADERAYASMQGVFFPSPTRIDRRVAALPHAVSINSGGFRGSEVSLAKPSSERRVLFVGDSFTWGDYVDDAQTLPSQFERSLAPSCPGVRALNFGVGGTTIDGQLEMLERGLALAPDLVVLVFHDNDVQDLRPPTYWSELRANRATKSRFPASLVYGVMRNTALWGVVRQSVARLQAQRRSPADPAAAAVRADAGTSAAPTETTDSLRAAYRRQLRAFAARTARAGVPLLVSAFPSHLAFRDARQTDYAWFASTVVAESLSFVDPLPVLRGSSLGVAGLYLLPHDAHASPAGYRLVASALAEQVRASPLSERLCRS